MLLGESGPRAAHTLTPRQLQLYPRIVLVPHWAGRKEEKGGVSRMHIGEDSVVLVSVLELVCGTKV